MEAEPCPQPTQDPRVVVPVKDRRPQLDPLELKRQAKRAKAELERAAEVPVPAEDIDDDRLLVDEEAEEVEEELVSPAATPEQGAARQARAQDNGHSGNLEEDYEVFRKQVVEMLDPDEPNSRHFVDVDEEVPEHAEILRVMAEAYWQKRFGQGAPEPERDSSETAQPPAPATSAAASSSAGCAPAKGEEAVCGAWVSEKGECKIFLDRMTSRLSYEESLPDGGRLHGWLLRNGQNLCWESRLWYLDEDQGPWYGPSFGEEPEAVGFILVRLCPGSPPTMETQIRVLGEDDDWQSPTSFRQKPEGQSTTPFAAFTASPGPVAQGSGGLFVFGS